MKTEPSIQRYRNWYSKLIRLYPQAHLERFGDEMKQTFNDLCRERVEAEKGLFSFALWIFFETSAGIIKENLTHIMNSIMNRDTSAFLTFLKYSGFTVSALMVAGIGTLMFLARGKGEDIAGIVAMALLMTLISGIIGTVAAILQRRAQKDVNK